MSLSAPRRGPTFSLFATALAVFAAGTVPAIAQQDSAPPAPAAKAAPAAKTKAPAESAAAERSADSYDVGVMFGTQLRDLGVTPADLSSERFQAGFHDALSGKASANQEIQQHATALVRQGQVRTVEANHQAAATFLADNGKKPGVLTTASGLQYKVVKDGSGAAPKPTDTVLVNYRGSLLDGREFDSSYKRGQPASFQVNKVIPGWTEALQLMKPGATYELYIPPQLAYDAQSPPGIPAGSLLKFQVELLSVQPPGAAAAAPNTPPAGK